MGAANPAIDRSTQQRFGRWVPVACVLLASTAACVTTVLAPGADKVRITQVPSDVSNCTAVGNIRVPRLDNGNVDRSNAEAKFRNRTIGLGGNTAFLTAGSPDVPDEGIAYRCP